MNLENICFHVRELAIQTGDFIRTEAEKFSNETIEVKGSNNFVTYVDKASEQIIVQGLKAILPEAGFITEEGTAKHNSETFKWVIDPLDGTTNFIHGLPPYAVSIGLIENNEPVLGVVYEVFSRECFYAVKGGKAYLNGKEIQVTETSKVSESLIAVGFPYTEFSRVKTFLNSLEYFFLNSHGVRRLGSAATDLAYIACGRFDGFYEYGLQPWDVAAGAIILKQAGGIVTDFNGGNNYLFGGEIVASNANVHPEFQNLINQFLTK